MACHIRDPETDTAVRRLARLKGQTLTTTIREAVDREYRRQCEEIPFMEHVRAIQERFRALGKPTGLAADKAFFDELSGEDELTGSL
jgi:antitoxin VapB